MRMFVLVFLASLSLTLGMVGAASAAPSPDHYPSNPNACVRYSSTSANTAYQGEDAAKYRDQQARGEEYTAGGTYVPAGEQGRRDDVQNIFAECEAGE